MNYAIYSHVPLSLCGLLHRGRWKDRAVHPRMYGLALIGHLYAQWAMERPWISSPCWTSTYDITRKKLPIFPTNIYTLNLLEDLIWCWKPTAYCKTPMCPTEGRHLKYHCLDLHAEELEIDDLRGGGGGNIHISSAMKLRFQNPPVNINFWESHTLMIFQQTGHGTTP